MTLFSFVAAAVIFAMQFSGGCRATEASPFVWGTATSSYQIEGAWNADNKGQSIWDHFVRQNGTIADKSTGDIACRSYEKYKEDVQLLKQIGVSGYRFSISWPRVIPTGKIADGVNEAGVQYYVNVVDELRANGIEPLVTLYHWDLPLKLQEEFQGWESQEIVQHFVDFSTLMFAKLGDKVKWWITFNEPWVFNVLGNGNGEHAPGKKDPVRTVYIVAHNVLRAHAKTYRVYDQAFRPTQAGQIGITLNGAFHINKTDSQADVEAAERAMQFIFGWYADPIYFGDYPAVMRDRIANKSAAAGLPESRLPKFTDEEKAEINGTSDFFGLNYYSSDLAEFTQGSNDGGYTDDMDVKTSKDPSWPGSGSSWLKVTPSGIRSAINWLSDRYGNPPIVVTENGVSDNNGTVSDQHRIDFYREYIGNVTQARTEDKRNVIGYFAWSLMDNFEWARGYTEHFGLVSVNFTDPERPRTLKDSAKWYREFIQTQTTTTTTLPPTTTTGSGPSASVLASGVFGLLIAFTAWAVLFRRESM